MPRRFRGILPTVKTRFLLHFPVTTSAEQGNRMPDRLPTTVERDSIIVEQMLTKQSTARELSDRYGLSLSRIYQIVGMRAGSDVPDTITSDLHLMRLDQLFFEMQRLALAPPSYKISPTGGVVEYEGEPLLDNAE